jgi:hypothetical protein
MNITDWINAILYGAGGLEDFEHYEMPIIGVPRDVFVARWIIRCLANPACGGSAEILDAIAQRREQVSGAGAHQSGSR